MNEFIRIIENTGAWSISEFWFPILIWTVFAALTIFVLHYSAKFNPLYHFHLRVASLLALPAGMLTIFAGSLFREAFYAAPDGVSGAFLVVQSPVEFSVSPSAAAETAGWLTPSFIAGTLFIIAAGISVFLLMRFAASYLHLHRFRKNLPAITLSSFEQLSDQNKSLVRKLNKKVTLAFGSDEFSPFTFGWKNPVIVVPQTFRKDSDKLNMIVGHELIHIRRGDYQLHLLQSLIRALFGFHPLVHIISTQAENYREISCDQEVLYETRISPKSYASLLVNLLPFSAKDVSPSIAMAVSNSNIKTRIKTMNTFKIHKTSYTRSFMFLLMLTVGMILPIACSDLNTTPSELSETDQDNITSNENGEDYGFSTDVIFVVNGEVFAKEKNKIMLSRLNPENIKSISVLKGDSAIKKYGDEAEKGVIEITTKTPFSLDSDVNNDFAPPSKRYDAHIVVETPPELIGGLKSIQRNIKYPELARRAGIEGRVIVQFIVDEQGNVVDPHILRGIGGGCDEAALEAVKQAKFEPGKQRGKAVRVQYSLPITFELPK